ncbi:MAG: LysM peptidoglycan-binding domain-containing protein [Chthoniobacterales bacterium]|nr:LysM peptidoglycan-binding domain-containing protein [Chthoniobacterales bacterium]
MKIPSIMMPKKLRATTARRSRSLGLPDDMDYEQMSEPNMKLSRALLIVLVLHIVAVAGIIAFNTIKTRETMATANALEAVATSAAAPAVTTDEPETAQPDEIAKVAVKTESKAPETAAEHAKPVIMTPAVPDSGKIYTVVKGDNPVTIARRLKVSEVDLLELNQITDPRKLQIGQKLHIPAASTATKSKSE